VAGVRIPPVDDLVLAPTPPPDIDVAAWERSIDTVLAWEPRQLVLTHFGTVADPAAQLEACRRALHEEIEQVGATDEPEFVERLTARIRQEAPEVADQLIQAVPPDHIHKGLARWRSKQGG
jgi:hypothetical protein